MRLYDDLVSWYPFIDPAEDHREEVASYVMALERGLGSIGSSATLLELGAGAGNNAFHAKARFQCTLTDLSEPMLKLSRAQNPECEHGPGDMRTLRLGRTFDAVLVHDAVMYMTTEKDLAAAAETAFVHTRPGGAAVFAPDYLRETFSADTDVIEHDDGHRAVRGLGWSWDPDPTDDTYRTDYLFLLRDGDDVRTVHDRHVEGLFARETWQRILAGVGFRVERAERHDRGTVGEIFLCVRPKE
jgi:SAM-dependent methyltransferase